MRSLIVINVRHNSDQWQLLTNTKNGFMDKIMTRSGLTLMNVMNVKSSSWINMVLEITLNQCINALNILVITVSFKAPGKLD